MLLLLAGFLLVESLQLGRLARLAPLWVVVPTVSLALLQLLVDVWPRLADALPALRQDTLAGGLGFSERSVTASRPPARTDTRRERELRGAAWMLALVALVHLLGLLAAAPAFLLLYLHSEAGLGWSQSLVISASAGGVIYVVFGVLADVPFPEGLIF